MAEPRRAAGPRRLVSSVLGSPRVAAVLDHPRVAGALRRLEPRSVRTRTTAAACLAVALVLLAACTGVLLLLHVNLERGIDDAAREQARVVARQAAAGQLASPLPLDHGTDFIQVVAADGTVLAASQNLLGQPALTPDEDGEYELGAPGDEEHQRVGTTTADTPSGPVTIHVGASLRTADTAEDLTAAALAALSTLLLATVAVLTWRTTGRALRPVEAIRAEVAAISERDLAHRVPEPRSEDEIARLARTMNAMLDRLESAGERQRRFIADASHELRSPLAVLRTQLEVAHTHPDPAVRAAMVEGALQDTDRLQALAGDLLLLARLDGPGGPRPDQPVDLAALVRSTVRARTPEGPPVSVDAPDHLPVLGNPQWLGRLLTNLLDNARRHAAHAVTVTLHAAPGGGAVLDVANDGPPIAPEDRERIFERFTRLDDARSRDDGGSGLGLAIAREIAVRHGGTLTVRTDGPDPACFRLALPR